MKAGHGRRLGQEDRERLAVFGARLRDARLELDLSALEISKRLPEHIRVSGASVRAYETAVTKPSRLLVQAVERILLEEQERRGAPKAVLREGELMELLSPPTASRKGVSVEQLNAEMAAMRDRMAELERELKRRHLE